MKIYINNADVTAYVHSKSLDFRLYDACRLRGSLTLDQPPTLPRIGMELELKDDSGAKICGGILTKTTYKSVPNCPMEIHLEVQGYDHIVYRGAVGNFTPQNNGVNVPEQYFDATLAPEGLVKNETSFAEAPTNLSYSHTVPTRHSAAMDAMAKSCHCIWWVDYEKHFRFASAIPLTTSNYRVDINDSTDINAARLLDFSVSEQTSEYCNCKFVLGAENVWGVCRDEYEVSQMQARFGTGVYADLEKNEHISTQEACNLEAELNLQPYLRPQRLHFTTTTPFRLFEQFPVTAIPYNIPNDTLFAATEIRISLSGAQPLYRVTAQRLQDNQFRPVANWIRSFAQFKKG